MSFSSKKAQMLIIYLISYVSAIGNPMILPCLPHIMEEFSLTPLEMSLLISVYALPAMLIIPFYGFLSDRLGRRPLLFLELLLCSAGSLICFYAQSFTILLVGRALQGISISPLESLSTTLASDLFEGEERMRMVTRVAVAQYLGVAISPMLTTYLLTVGSWRLSFLYGVLLGLAALVISLPVQLAYSSSHVGSIDLYKKHLKEMLRSRRVLSLFSVRFTNSLLLFGVVYAHFPLLLKERAPEALCLIGVAYSAYAAGMFFGSLFTSRINARFGTKRTGLLSGLVTTAALSLLFSMQNIQTGLLAMALVGIGIAIMNATCVGHVSLATTDDTKGSIMSAYSAIFRAGQALSPIICGFYFQMTGSSGLFGTAALLALALSFWAASVFSFADRIEHRTGIL